MTPECPREHDVVAAILARRWPDECDEALPLHARQCALCRDLVAVVHGLREDSDRLGDEVTVPCAGQVWWRSAVRARLEATEAVGRPLAWLYGFAGACAAGLLVALAGLLWPAVHDVAAWMGVRRWAAEFSLGQAAAGITSLVPAAGLLAVGAAACLLLAPLALYLALSDE